MRLSLLAVCVAATLAAGCTRQPVRPAAADPGPDFDPIAFFDGHTHSWGVIESRSGAPAEQIVTDSTGERDGTGRLHLVQHLSFQDGTTQKRNWTLWRSGPNQFDATATDMVGTAKGEANGRIFHWRWVLARFPGNPLMNVTMQQWIYRVADGSVIIRTTISKFGFIVAEATEQFTNPAGA